jgi:hypothetical protein
MKQIPLSRREISISPRNFAVCPTGTSIRTMFIKLMRGYRYTEGMATGWFTDEFFSYLLNKSLVNAAQKVNIQSR